MLRGMIKIGNLSLIKKQPLEGLGPERIRCMGRVSLSFHLCCFPSESHYPEAAMGVGKLHMVRSHELNEAKHVTESFL